MIDQLDTRFSAVHAQTLDGLKAWFGWNLSSWRLLKVEGWNRQWLCHSCSFVLRVFITLMLSCSACRASLTALKTVARYGLRLSNSFRIGLATSSRHSSTNADDCPTLRQETLTVVYKVSKFILSQTTDSDSSTRFVQLWDRILSRIRQDLTTENARPIRVVGKCLAILFSIIDESF